MKYTRPFDILVYTSKQKIESALNIILPSAFSNGKYHIKERYDVNKLYLSIQNESEYHSINTIPDEIILQ